MVSLEIFHATILPDEYTHAELTLGTNQPGDSPPSDVKITLAKC